MVLCCRDSVWGFHFLFFEVETVNCAEPHLVPHGNSVFSVPGGFHAMPALYQPKVI